MSSINLSEFQKKIDAGRVKCLEKGCTFTAHSIAGHIQEVHNITTKDYKKNHGKGAKLASRLTAEFLRVMPRTAQRTSDLGSFIAEFDFVEVGTINGKLDAQLAALKKSLPKVSKELAELVPAENPDFLFTDELLQPLSYALQQGVNIYVAGPTGCGKTDGVMQFLNRAGQPVQRVNMNGEVTYRNFVGSKEASGGETRFDEGFLPKAMRGDGTRGYALVIDELDYTPPQIAALLNPVLEDGQTLYIPESGETIVANPGFMIIATGNTGGRGDRHGNFTGTEVLNTAFLDRFSLMVNHGYLPADLEGGLISGKFASASEAEVKAMVLAAGLIRTAFMEGQMNVTLSTRKLLEFFKMRQAMDLDTVLAVSFLNWMDDDDVTLARELIEKAGLPGFKATP